MLLLVLYLAWAVIKNYKYVKNIQAVFMLPVLQITADMAVMSGTIVGIIKLWDIKKKQ